MLSLLPNGAPNQPEMQTAFDKTEEECEALIEIICIYLLQIGCV